MAISRYHMRNMKKGIMVEAPYNAEGLKRLRHFRELNQKDWKNARIVPVIQALPSKVDVYRVYKLT